VTASRSPYNSLIVKSFENDLVYAVSIGDIGNALSSESLRGAKSQSDQVGKVSGTSARPLR